MLCLTLVLCLPVGGEKGVHEEAGGGRGMRLPRYGSMRRQREVDGRADTENKQRNVVILKELG